MLILLGLSSFDRYYNERARRHNVLPGITGWSQINGRNAITWNQKFEPGQTLYLFLLENTAPSQGCSG
jgi:lipopolysaccharide/colanic/teichoic acid biosynthesis glycosyltransferase